MCFWNSLVSVTCLRQCKASFRWRLYTICFIAYVHCMLNKAYQLNRFMLYEMERWLSGTCIWQLKILIEQLLSLKTFFLNWIFRHLEERGEIPACEVTTVHPITYDNLVAAFLIIPLGVFISLATLCFEHIVRWTPNQQKSQSKMRRPTKRLLDLRKSHLESNATWSRVSANEQYPT